MFAKKISVVVARAHLNGKIQIDVEAPREIRVAKGKTVVVQVPFKPLLSGEGDETFKLRLAARLGTRAAAPVEATSGDRRGLGRLGSRKLEQSFTADRPGTYKLRYEIRADYTCTSSGATSTERSLGATRAGEIIVTVTE